MNFGTMDLLNFKPGIYLIQNYTGNDHFEQGELEVISINGNTLKVRYNNGKIEHVTSGSLKNKIIKKL